MVWKKVSKKGKGQTIWMKGKEQVSVFPWSKSEFHVLHKDKEGYLEKLEEFNTESKAMAYARSYMRKN